MTHQEKRHAALVWWNSLSFGRKVYKVVEWLKDQGMDTTVRHPNNLTGREIQQIWESEKF